MTTTAAGAAATAATAARGAATAAAASCGPDQVSGFNSGILTGNQFSNVVQVPIDISGNAISILGFASARSVGGAAAVNC